mgnify:CR=1 FL=1
MPNYKKMWFTVCSNDDITVTVLSLKILGGGAAAPLPPTDYLPAITFTQ